MAEFTVFTDGSARPNPGLGGYAALVIREGHEDDPLLVTGRKTRSTNQEMELLAIIEGLLVIYKSLAKDDEYLDNVVTVISDSEWAIKCLIGKYKSSKYPHWFAIAKKLMKKFVVHYEHIRSHTGDDTFKAEMNRLCDKEAKQQVDDVKELGNAGWWKTYRTLDL